MRKLTVLLAGGIGYVLGARAGRERFEQIRRTATRVKDNPTVQSAASTAASSAADAAKHAAPVVKDAVVSAAEKVKGSDDDVETPAGTTAGTPTTT